MSIRAKCRTQTRMSYAQFATTNYFMCIEFKHFEKGICRTVYAPTKSYDLIHLKWKIMLCQNRHNKSYLF